MAGFLVVVLSEGFLIFLAWRSDPGAFISAFLLALLLLLGYSVIKFRWPIFATGMGYGLMMLLAFALGMIFLCTFPHVEVIQNLDAE